MKIILNLKDLISRVSNVKIWLRDITIANMIFEKYGAAKELDFHKVLAVARRFSDYIPDFMEYKFVDGTEYIVTEYGDLSI